MQFEHYELWFTILKNRQLKVSEDMLNEEWDTYS
jgi:hypothetical protein